MSDIYNTIATAMARALWCDAWASWADEQHQKDRSVRHYPPGCELMDYMPELPPRAHNEAWRLFGQIEALNGCHMCHLCVRAYEADKVEVPADFAHAPEWVDCSESYWRDFGHYLAMMALGHGVSWFDDHADFEIKFPSYTYVDFSEELADLEDSQDD